VLIRGAREEAILTNATIVVAFDRQGYRLLTPDEKGALAPLTTAPGRDGCRRAMKLNRSTWTAGDRASRRESFSISTGKRRRP